MRRAFVILIVVLSAVGAATKEPSTDNSKAPSKSGESSPAVYDSADVAAGAKLYKQSCLPCHGKNGEGNGPAAATLKPKPRNFHRLQDFKSKNDDDLFKVISNGGASVGLSPMMVAWKSTFKEAQIRQLIAYVRSFAANDSAAAPPKEKPSDKKP